MIIQTYTPTVDPVTPSSSFSAQYVRNRIAVRRRNRPTPEQMGDWGWTLLDDLVAIAYNAATELGAIEPDEEALHHIFDAMDRFMTEAYED